MILVYVPGPKNTEAANKISKCFIDALEKSLDQLVFILGDFNTCDTSAHLPALQQYITCPTCSTRILDKCFGNILDAYKAFSRPALGKSDHIVIMAGQRLFFMRKLKTFDVSQSVLEMVYKSHVESILMFNIKAYCDNLGLGKRISCKG